MGVRREREGNDHIKSIGQSICSALRGQSPDGSGHGTEWWESEWTQGSNALVLNPACAA